MNQLKWILVAEDDAPTAELTTRALAPEELACEVIVAHDGLEALDCINHRGGFGSRGGGPPTFVLLDLKMPKLNGLEVLRQIKSDDRLKSIPVIMFTSSREAADVNLCYQLGANAYVVKPVEFRQFHETVRRVGLFWAMMNEQPPAGAPAALEAAAAPTRLAAAV
jgi:CheY-like chemotaxis protein